MLGGSCKGKLSLVSGNLGIAPPYLVFPWLVLFFGARLELFFGARLMLLLGASLVLFGSKVNNILI